MPGVFKELTEHQRSEIETLAALLSQDQIADYLGIGKTTFYQLRQRDPDIDERYKRGKAKAIAHVANGLLQKARTGDTTSAIFYLKTQAGWRETDRIEHSGQITKITREIVSPVERLKAVLDEKSGRSAPTRPDLIEGATTIVPSGQEERAPGSLLRRPDRVVEPTGATIEPGGQA